MTTLISSGPEGHPPAEHCPELRAALDLAAQDVPVFPCRAKRPLTPRGFKDATTDAATIKHWWARGPAAQLGVPTGRRSGLIVLDVDPRHGGDRALTELLQRAPALPATVTAATGGGGWHYFFAAPALEHIPSRTLAPGLELKAEGGYVIVPPSLHHSGRRYEWHQERALGRFPLAPLPQWLGCAGNGRPPADAAGTIPEGERNATLCRIAGAMRRQGCETQEIEAALRAVNARCAPPLEEREVARIAASVGRYPPAAEEAAEPRKRQTRREPTQAEELRALFDRRYRLGRALDGEPYAVPLEGSPIVRTFRGGRASLRGELARAYAREHGRGPCAEALADCLLLLEAEAEEAPRQEVALRVATRSGPECWLDLGRPDGRLVRVTREGWTLEGAAPVLFRRSELTGELPAPARPGDLGPWLRLMNVGDDDRSAILAWLVTVLLGLPVPILLLRGPAGAAKSTAARMIARLLDPGPAPLRAPPRDMDGWAVGAQGSLIVPCDNVTTIPEWWSDALCRAVTGDGVVRRALYTDSALSVLAFRRAVILTAIDAGALRGDLTDRLLSVELAEIRERDRRDDADVEAAFAAAWPAALGGLLTLAVQVLDLLPSVRLDRRPRMADFGRVLAAVDAIRRTRALDGYARARVELAREAAEGDAVGARILGYMADRREWRGTAAELLAALQPADKPPRGWPETARALSGRLRRLVGPLRAAGIEVAFGRMGHTRVRTVTLTATTGGVSADR